MQVARYVTALALTGALAGCGGDLPYLTKASDDEVTVASRRGSFEQTDTKQHSEIIGTLQARKSLITTGSPYDTVATAALTASSRSSEAELRSAKLRAEAKSKNWLPTIGPNVSLSSLGDLVAGILVEQVLFDNGRRKAERAFAAADVEVAAVNLSIDMNDRVQTALSLYVSGLRADEKARLSSRALQRMHGFERIVIGRVQGGVSDRSDQRVIEAKLNDMRAAQSTAQEAAETARAELKAMTGQSFGTGAGALDLATIPQPVDAMDVLRAEAEAERAIAQAEMDHATLLPGLTASANVTGSGSSGGLNLGTSQALGLGTGAQLRAIEASKETAARQIDEARETARRRISRLKQRLSSFRRQEAEASELARSSQVTFDLFKRQFDAGQRSVMDVINVYEQLVERENALIDAKYEVLLIQLEIARDYGVLVDGGSI